jgi:hypothetical protein
MHNLFFDFFQEQSYEEFTNRVLQCLSVGGFNSEAVALIMEKAEDTIEQLEILETCLSALSVCGNEKVPEKKYYGNSKDVVRREAIPEESRKMLEELYMVREQASHSLYDSPRIA